jgi:hypothetical protein
MKKLVLIALGALGLFAIARAHHRRHLEEEARFWGDA